MKTIVPRMTLAAVGLVLMLALESCADHGQKVDRATAGSPASAAFRCPVTMPNDQTPPGETRSPLDLGNGRLWTGVPVDGKLVVSMTRPGRPGTALGEINRDGSIATKFPWWGAKSAGRDLRITGRRLDGPAKPLRASVAPGLTHAPHFWASTITFATQGCWQVTGTAGTEKLTFVVQVMRG